MLTVGDFVTETRPAVAPRKELKKTRGGDLFKAENSTLRVRVVWSKDRGNGGRLSGLLKLLVKDSWSSKFPRKSELTTHTRTSNTSTRVVCFRFAGWLARQG
jgi:hypothetical protein